MGFVILSVATRDVINWHILGMGARILSAIETTVAGIATFRVL